jgi:DNA polymerase-3 subunit epsilon
MMREIVLDTETTGLDPAGGHRIVEIGCVELLNHVPSGQVFHCYLNPERDMPDGAFAVHGLSEEFLAKHPLFGSVAEDFLDFIGDDPLIIHNADFDMKFVNWELTLVNRPALPRHRAIDTVQMARRRFPGSPASLDALCRRFGIDNSARDKHGALLDAELLAEVYLELIGGREPGLLLTAESRSTLVAAPAQATTRQSRPARPHAASPDEVTQHQAFIAQLNDPIWSKS